MTTTTTFPTQRALAETAAELALAAQQADDRRNANALNKAAYHLAAGLRVMESAGDLLIPSATTAGQIYRVSKRGCTCQAGLAGAQCWHASLLEIVSTARERQEELTSVVAGDTPICCGLPMLADDQTIWCSKCKFWQFR